MKAVLRAGIPLVIMTAIGVALLFQDKAADGRATLAVGVIVAAVAGASVIYDIAGWSLRKQSLVHLALMFVTVLPALLLSGWFPLDSAGDYVAVIGAFIAGGAILWALRYLVFGRLVPRMTAARDKDADAAGRREPSGL